MRTPSLLLMLAVGCTEYGLSPTAEDVLATRATGGPEEYVDGDGSLAPQTDRPLLHDCDAAAEYDRLFGAADADASGTLDAGEARPVKRGPPPEHWAVLGLVYDADDSGSLDDAERATLLDDFTARCEVMTQRVVDEFDTNGDGTLDESELAAAQAALDDRQATCDQGGMPPGDGSSSPQAGPPGGMPPQDGASQDPGGLPPLGGDTADHGVPPPLLDEFDTNGDGQLDTAELDVLRQTVRQRIRDGVPPGPPR